MNWDIIVRCGITDDYLRPHSGNPSIFIDFERKGSPYLLSHSIGKELNNLPQRTKELLYLAMAVYSADRYISRDFSHDGWSRNITINFPVSSVDIWESAYESLKKALDFLTGDNWSFRFRSTTTIENSTPLLRLDDICVSLFSGGADSLVGAIDLLAQGQKAIFVGHYGKGVTHSFQNILADDLKQAYSNSCDFVFRYVEPARIINCKKETSPRGRSFLFLTLAVAEGSFRSNHTTLYVPENGLISLNIPLVESRTGSLSTRTTHPYFLAQYRQFLRKINLDVTIMTPYQFKTKGEMFGECLNPKLLQILAPKSVSCSHPESSRWRQLPPNTHCGRCFPCLIRKASFVAANIPDGSNYDVDVLQAPPQATKAAGSDYRAVMMAIRKFTESRPSADLFKVMSSGPLPPDNIDDFIGVYVRGMNELSKYLTGAER